MSLWLKERNTCVQLSLVGYQVEQVVSLALASIQFSTPSYPFLCVSINCLTKPKSFKKMSTYCQLHLQG